MPGARQPQPPRPTTEPLSLNKCPFSAFLQTFECLFKCLIQHSKSFLSHTFVHCVSRLRLASLIPIQMSI